MPAPTGRRDAELLRRRSFARAATRTKISRSRAQVADVDYGLTSMPYLHSLARFIRSAIS